jgi:hypothetical protein
VTVTSTSTLGNASTQPLSSSIKPGSRKSHKKNKTAGGGGGYG